MELMEPNGGPAIEAEGLVKVFGDTRAVDGIDLAVPPGTVYGLLGPNGAGKTTTIRMLATLLRPDGGWARAGERRGGGRTRVRGAVSLTGQFASVDEELTGRENLVLLGRLLGFSRRPAEERARELLDAFGLLEARDRLVREYSGGMRRRLDIAASIVISPELLFLDEPTTGLDPRSRNQVWEIIRVLVAAGTTVLLTTQYLDEADELADRIAIVDHGKVIAEGTSAELKALVGSGTLRVRLQGPEQRPAGRDVLSRVLGEAVQLESDPAVLSARAPDADRVATALAELASAGITVAEFAVAQPSLDEVFLALTGHPTEPDEDAAPRRTQHDHDHPSRAHPRRRAAAVGTVHPGAACSGQRARCLVHLRLAGDAEDQARPHAALRRDHVPGHVRAALHVPLRRGARGSPSAYLQELLPGILVMTVTMITMYTGMALNTDIDKGVFDRFRSLPIWRPAVLVGMLLADTVRYTLASLVVITLGVVLGFRPDGGPLGVVLAVALLLVFSFSLSWVWTAIGLTMETPESVMQVSMTVLFPLTFASNVFVDPDTMPGWVQAFVDVNPVSHLTTAARGLMHGGSEASAIAWVLAWSVGLVAVFAPLTMRLYRAER